MYVAEIWRYPVKSMAGELCQETPVLASGIVGDRVIQIDDGHGRVITARTHPRLLGHRATLDAAGEPLVDGRLWTDPAVLAAVQRIAGPDARLVHGSIRTVAIAARRPSCRSLRAPTSCSIDSCWRRKPGPQSPG